MAETGLSADGNPVVDIVEDLAVEEAAPQFAAQPSLPVISFEKTEERFFVTSPRRNEQREKERNTIGSCL